MQKNKILLVDDEKTILVSSSRDFEHAGYEVSTAASGEDAVTALQCNDFDLVITDLAMPGIDGIAVLLEAKRKDPDIGAIILTGYGDITSSIKAMRLGADDYLLKPCDADELLLRAERCLEKRNMLKQIEKQNKKIVESELQKTLLLNCVAEGIYGIDTQGKVTFINPTAEKMLGYTASELIDKNCHTLIHHTKANGRPYPEEECWMHNSIDKSEKFYAAEDLFWRKNGTSFPVECTCAPITYNNEVVGAVVLFTDLTEKKEQEERQHQMECHIQQQQKFQSLNSMAAGIAHNFNNILSVVIGNQDLALLGLSINRKERDYIEEAQKASLRAANISTMMLQFVGQAENKKQQFKMSELINEMIEILNSQIASQIELCYKSAQGTFLLGDVGMIRQVIVNLVSNAAESIGTEKGEISLQHGQHFYTQEELKQAHMPVELPAGEYVYLTVTDNGPGMDRDGLARAFEPFYSTKFTGRGMGLAATLGIMRTHNGTVLLESQPGKGLIATVLFPALATQCIPVEQTPHAAPSEDVFIGTVLLVDDEKLLRDLWQVFLNRMGFEVLQAADSIEALDIFDKNMQEISLVLMDISMPRLNGAETLNKIREKSMVPVVMMTGYAITQIAEQFNAISNVCLIQKPFSPEALKSKIQDIMPHS